MHRPNNPVALRAIAKGLSERARRAELAECFQLATLLEESARTFRADADRFEATLAREF